MKSDKNFYLFFLSKIPKIGSATIRKLLSEKKPDERITHLIAEKQKDKKFVSKVSKEFSAINENYLTILDENYPNILKNIYDPPLFLFYRGNKKILNQKNLLTIVGSRKLSTYHQSATENLIQKFQGSDLVIASGLAIGIDAVSHQAALKNNLPTVAVLGSGLSKNVLYPQSNIRLAEEIIKNNGLLISEYPSQSRPQLHYFPKRNRILAGMSKATIVISGALKSGTLITAQVALDEGREIFALPGNIQQSLSQGTNSLIANGAQILLSAEDILKTYDLENKNSKKETIIFKNKDHAKIYTLLQTEPLNLDELTQRSKQPLSYLNSLISQWEIKGLVKFNQFNQVEII
ncbi:DNA-processing protein DprA [bacterium]|nr:DNA-processing protein DprA [bacterium]